VVPPEDRTIVVPPRTPDDCVVALPDGSRWWVSLPPPVQALLPHGLRAEGARKQRPPNGLLTRAQAAAKLNCSLRTLDGHVASGTLRYVVIGHGKKRARRMFTDADLNEFIANRTRKDVPCPSIASGARRSGSSISGFEVIAFTGLRNARPGGKPKK
jgi:helix-turn-helix protein